MTGTVQRRFSLLLLFVLLLSVVWTGSAGAQPAGGIASGEILVKFQPGTPGSVEAAVHRQNGGQVKETIQGIDVRVVSVPAGQEAARVAAYQHNPNVEYSELNDIYWAYFTPNDPSYPQQFQYNNANDADIDAPEAWDVTTGDTSVKVAVLDTGIDQDHPDLSSKIAVNKNFSSSKSVDDKYGHGTHVAGTVAAITNNGLGVAGTCPSCVLMNVKVLGDNGSGSLSAIANGITWAADNGAKVISMSLGATVGSTTMKNAVDYAWNKGVVVVAAAGNSSTSAPSYPAYYTNAIAVAATDSNDAIASFSNYGSWVDVAAPGVSILSTAPNHRNSIWRSGVSYGTISGTSMATPHVAGIAGLVWSRLGSGATASQVRSQIESTADKIAGTGTKWTYGRVNAYNAVK